MPRPQVEPKYLTITNHHVIAANDESVYVWQFRTAFSKTMSTDVTGMKRKDAREKVFHADDPNPAQVRTRVAAARVTHMGPCARVKGRAGQGHAFPAPAVAAGCMPRASTEATPGGQLMAHRPRGAASSVRVLP